MAFDQHVAADQVGDGDVGLFSSLARPILWLLGDQDKNEEGKRKEERDKLEREILVASDVSDDGADDENGEKTSPCDRGGAEGSSQGVNDGGGDIMDMDIDAAGGGREGKDDAVEKNNSNKISTSLQSWPQIDHCDDEDDHHHRRSCSENYVQPPRRRDNCSPVTQIVDDLVAVMESSTIDPGPATSAADSSSPNTMALPASHSASAFPNHQIPQLHHAHSSNSSIRSKKTSWSDERGSRPLVEYSDDLKTSYKSEHWTQLRRKKVRRNSFDGDDKRSGTRRSQVRVIKSALRSGSYSPPVTKMYASGGAAMSTSSSTSSTSSSRQSPPTGGDMRSFHSLSMIGSSSSDSSSPDPFNLSTNSSDSLAAETNQKLSMADNVHVPSTLQQGRGGANGLIIPRGGPSAAYHLTLGTRVGGEHQGRGVAKENNQAEGGANAPLNGNNYVNNGRKISPHHHMFLPHPPNGYVSPQYGFYVNITPPTPIHAAKRGSPLRPFEESSPQQQSYQQVNTFPPSPIPEVEFVNEKRPGPKLDPMPESVEPRAMKTRLKPTFPKNRVGMGMVLAGNHHSHAWPSIPMG